MQKIKPEVIAWARETAGLTQEIAAKKLGIKDSKSSSAVSRLLLYEKTGEVNRSLIVKMAKLYRRPLITFYLNSPPRSGYRGQDFRTLPEDYSKSENNLLDVLIRDVIARQSIVKSAIEDDEDIKPLSFIGSLNMSDGITAALNSIRNILKIHPEDYYQQPNQDKAFSLLRESAETNGVYVLLIGDLGSYHTKIEPEIFRGFTIADRFAPFIVINDRDSHSAWSFTLLHEFIHLCLGQTGVSNTFTNKTIEKFCNDVAGDFLLPEDQLDFLKVNNDFPLEEIIKEITYFSYKRNLSDSLVAYKLFRTGRIDENIWRDLNKTFREKWYQSRIKYRESSKQDGGPNYYLIRKHRVGKSLINLVDHLMLQGSLSTSKASIVLGVKAKNVGNLIEVTRSG